MARHGIAGSRGFLTPPRKFSPLDGTIPGLFIWWDGLDGRTMFDAASGGSLAADGAQVLRWEDKSDNGQHLNESNTTSPIRTAGKGLTYDGTATLRRSFTNWGATLAQPFEVIFALQIGGFTTTQRFFSSGTGGTAGAYVSNAAKRFVNAGTNMTLVGMAAKWEVNHFVFDESGGNSAIWLNGVDGAATGTPGASGTDGISIGSAYGWTAIMSGIIGDVLIFNQVLTNASRWLLYSWLAGRHLIGS